MKKSALLILSLALGFAVQAQSDTDSKPFHFDFHGFVNPHFYADSRSVVGGREDMMLFYPSPSPSTPTDATSTTAGRPI